MSKLLPFDHRRFGGVFSDSGNNAPSGYQAMPRSGRAIGNYRRNNDGTPASNNRPGPTIWGHAVVPTGPSQFDQAKIGRRANSSVSQNGGQDPGVGQSDLPHIIPDNIIYQEYEGRANNSEQNDSADLIRIGMMFYGPRGATINVVPYHISWDTTYGMLSREGMARCGIDDEDMGAYLMTSTGIYRVDQSDRPIYDPLDLSLIQQARMSGNKFDLLFHIHNIDQMNYIECGMLLYPNGTVRDQILPNDAIISQGGPFGSYGKYWIDLSRPISIKVAVAPCNTCTSSDNCHIGLIYGAIITLVELIIGPNYTYETVSDMIKRNLVSMSSQLGLDYRVTDNYHLYLYGGNIYYDLSGSKRLVYQDYTLWQYWANLPEVTGQQYGPYFHLCPPQRVHAIPIDYDTPMIGEHTLAGGNHYNLVDLYLPDQVIETTTLQ